MRSPEELAREKIDKLLAECGWTIQNRSTINLSASRGVAIREAQATCLRPALAGLRQGKHACRYLPSHEATAWQAAVELMHRSQLTIDV